MRQENLKRLERQEAQRTTPAAWVAIYDPATGEPLNGNIPATATTIIRIPHNWREEVTSERDKQ